MKKNVLLTGLGLVLAVCVVMVSRMACANDTDSRASAARERVTPVLNSFLGPCGARVGSPVFLRAVKEDSLLELWVKPDKGERYVLVKRYPIAAWSGGLGPSRRKGTDRRRRDFMRWFPPD